jgi:IS30 family transposase
VEKSAFAKHAQLTAPNARRNQTHLESLSEILEDLGSEDRHRGGSHTSLLRRILRQYLEGRTVRDIASRMNISKDTVHRLIRRPRIDQRVRVNQYDNGRGQSERYYRLGSEFCVSHQFKWALDREIWTLHVQGNSARVIGLAIGVHYRTVQHRIKVTELHFGRWLKARPADAESNDAEFIAKEFERFSREEKD